MRPAVRRKRPGALHTTRTRSNAVAPARRLTRDDFNRPTLEVARDLLGKFIVSVYRGRAIAAMIAEVEAYKGPRDRAAHTYGGRRTARVEALYGDGGVAYVYLCYGIHWMLNFSTRGHDIPEGVLIRGIIVPTRLGALLLAGPGKVTRHLKIDRRVNGIDTTASPTFWVEDRSVRFMARDITVGPRVGVDYAGPYWAGRLWRFSAHTAAAHDAIGIVLEDRLVSVAAGAQVVERAFELQTQRAGHVGNLSFDVAKGKT